MTPLSSDKTPNKLDREGRGRRSKTSEQELDTRFLGSHLVQVLLTLDQGLD